MYSNAKNYSLSPYLYTCMSLFNCRKKDFFFGYHDIYFKNKRKLVNVFFLDALITMLHIFWSRHSNKNNRNSKGEKQVTPPINRLKIVRETIIQK